MSDVSFFSHLYISIFPTGKDLLTNCLEEINNNTLYQLDGPNLVSAAFTTFAMKKMLR
jgi:hypothetical protein